MTPLNEKLTNSVEVILNDLYPKTEYEGDYITVDNTVNGLFGKVKSDEETNITVCNKNLVNLNTITKNYIVGADGTFQSYSGESLTDYIKAKSNTNYYFSLEDRTLTGLYVRIGLYDSNKELISRVISTSSYKTFETTEDTEYIVFSYPSKQVPMLEIGDTLTDYIEHQEQTYTGTEVDFKTYDDVTLIYNTDKVNMTASVRQRSN